MDDTCAVCAEMLEWAAYGQCGHLDICSTCIARLRFICDDRRCCICKSESNIIFVTKALGDYTRMINDFSIFPVDPTEGQAGPYWFHEGTQAFFDNLDHYKMIAAMCKLSCIVCDKKDEQSRKGSKRRGKFGNIEQLKSHLFHHHKLFMCSLCLGGRKVFVCEQKLYTREQLNQHISTGDSEVDGSESERGGFMGHPKCEFCRNPFYGDNELYTHMSTEHYTCHICQRQHPGQYDYYRNYDDLEIHFRREHFLCQDEACLAKKFIVFTTESEMKRHNAMEHGGRMSRSKRKAALQIPISFQYRRSWEQDQSGRGHSFHPDYSNSRLSLANQASLGTANADIPRATSSRAQADSDHRETSEIDTILGLFESLASTDSEPSSRYCQAGGQNSKNGPLEESSFPPLPVAARKNHQKPINESEGLGRNTMAACLHRQNNVTILNASQARQAANSQPTLLRNDSEGLSRNTMGACFRHRNNVTVLNVSQARPAASPQPNSLIGGSSQLRPNSSIGKPATVNGVVPSNFSSSMQIRSATADVLSASSGSSTSKTKSSKMFNPSASAPKLVDRGSLDPSVSNFPPVSATHSTKLITNTQPSPEVEDVRTVNKSLVERIRAELEFDKDKYAAFKVISSEYRRGVIDTGEYVAYVHQFGLSHLILELARVCPDAQKQKELVEASSSSLRSNGPLENSPVDNTGQLKYKKCSKKGKEKRDDNGISGSNSALADSSINSVRGMQLNRKPSEEVVLPKNGFGSAKGKSMVWVDDEQADLHSSARPPYGPRVQNQLESAADGSKKSSETRGGGNKLKKRTSKFHRVRLGESSLAAVLELTNSDPGPHLTEGQSDGNSNGPHEGLPVRGAWQDGGGQRLVANFR